MNKYIVLLRLNKPIGIFLLLWPTLWALWLSAKGVPPVSVLCVFILGVILMRSAGCVINDIFDRNFDRYVSRTRYRPLTTGEIPIKNAFLIFLGLLMCAASLLFFLNELTIKLAFFAVLFTIIYPLLKRVTYLPQLGLGMTFAWGIPMAFAATLNELPVSLWWIFLVACIWTVLYDTLYAMSDRLDDLRIGIKSTAILFGSWDLKIIIILQIIMILFLIKMGFVFHLSYLYYFSLVFVIGLFLYQIYLVRHREPSACLQAFLNNHWVGCIIFLGIIKQ